MSRRPGLLAALAGGLNFAQPQRPARPRSPLPGAVLLTIAILIAAGLVWQYLALAGRLDELEVRLAQVQGRVSREAQPVAETVAGEMRFAAEALAQGTIPWGGLFADIEAAAMADVALLALNPDAARQEIRISGEARDFTALAAYQERLASRSTLASVQLLSHQLVSSPAGLAVRFELLAIWSAP